jgi:hypothetical protein
LIGSNILTVQYAHAQSIPKPSVPEFTVRFVDQSYGIPSSTSIDPYTGKTVTNPAHYVINYTIQLTIKNQTYPSSLDLFYNIRVKAHYQEDNWTTLYGHEYSPRVTNTDLTLVFSCNSNNSVYRNFYRGDGAEIYAPPEGQIDVQVEAFQAGEDYYQSTSNPLGSWSWTIRVESGWSPTQTITIPESTQTTSSPAPTASNPPLTPNQSTIPSSSADLTANLTSVPLSLLVAVVVVFLVVIISLLIFYRRPRQSQIQVSKSL